MKSAFTVINGDGVRLAAKLWRPSNDHRILPVIIFVHQYAVMGGSSALMEGMARNAVDFGYTCVTFDLRGAGGSTGSSTWTNFEELNDVKAIIDHVAGITEREIVLFGSSGGAAIAGAALDYSDRVKAVCLIGYTWGWMSSFLFGWAYADLERSIKPKLFVVGDRDEFTSMATYEAKIGALSGVKEMKLIPGKNHFEIEGPAFDRIVIDWFDQFLKSSGIVEAERGNISTKNCDDVSHG